MTGNVVALRGVDEPRHLAHRAFQVEPPAGAQPIAHVQWTLEQRLTELADRGESPYAALVELDGEQLQKARAALDEVFLTAQDVADRANSGVGSLPVYLYEDAYSDALYDLAQIVRGAA